MTVLVLLDHADSGAPRATASELVALARTLDGPVEGVWVGAAPLPPALPAGLARVHRVAVAHDEHLTTSVAEALAAVVDATGARVLLLASTFENKDVAARLGALAGAGVVTDADAVAVEDGRVVAGKTVLAGTWTTRVEVVAPLAVVLVKPGAAVADDEPGAGAPQVVERVVEPSYASGLVEVVERTERAGTGRPDLASAHAVVVGGRGTGGDFGPIEELADVLGAAVGATRVATDEGWVAREAQVGQTGVTVSPRLYVGAGVSGAVHHRGGMQSAGTIVAVDLDPDAPIFEIADYGIVGDLFQVLPQAAAELRRLRG